MKNISLLLAALALATTASAQRLVIKGSDTLGAKLVPTLAEEYKIKNSGVSFEIAAEGSTTGISAVIDGTAQIGMSSRRVKTTEVSAAQAKGVVVVATARTRGGRVQTTIRRSEANIVPGDNLPPEKARILLALALTRTTELSEIKRIFDQY